MRCHMCGKKIRCRFTDTCTVCWPKLLARLRREAKGVLGMRTLSASSRLDPDSRRTQSRNPESGNPDRPEAT